MSATSYLKCKSLAVTKYKEEDMTAQEFIDKNASKKRRKDAVVLGLIELPDRKWSWFHIHRDEEISHIPVIKFPI